MKGVRLLRGAFSLSLGGLIGVGVALAAWAQEVDRSFFLSPPRLLGAETTFNRVANSNAVYLFTLELPENAGSGVQQVQIAQKDGASRARLVLYEEIAEAFVGTPDDREADLAVAEVGFDRDRQILSIRFDPPIPPGTTFTVRLHPQRNPRLSGVYLFGVTAYPTGAADRGQFLGYGRLHFYNGDSLPLF